MELQQTEHQRGTVGELMKLMRIDYRDIITASEHSRDFNASRANYICTRVNILALLFAMLSLMWIPIDWFIVSDEQFGEIFVLRLIFSALLLGLAFWRGTGISLTTAKIRLAVFVVVPGLFYVGSRVVFNGSIDEGGALLGYSFFPFLMVALLTIVPLTLIEGFLFITLSASFYVIAAAINDHLFSFEAMGDFWLLTLLAMVAMWVQMSQLQMLMRLYREATRDALTGLVNRRVFISWLERERDAALVTKKPLSVLLMDLDKFKRVNDDYGHLTGDRVLERFSQLLQRTLPKSALVGRYGGEEFIAILPNTSGGEAAKEADKVREACHGEQVPIVDGEGEIGFTTSIGVTELRGGDAVNDILARADNGLYSAKTAGRDCVVVNQER